MVAQFPRVKEFLTPLPVSTAKTYRAALVHLDRFLKTKYNENVDSIVNKLVTKEIDVYALFNQFISYLPSAIPGITEVSINNYVNGGVKSYFDVYDVDMQRFRRKVKLPVPLEVERTAIDKDDIRNFLKVCKLDRLKAYLIVLATSGMRDTSDACTIRNTDVDDSSSPTRIKIRGQFSKRKKKGERIVYISDEATEYLNRWKSREERQKDPDRLLFSKNDSRPIPYTVEETKRIAHNLYQRFNEEFHEILKVLKMDEREDHGAKPRHKITMHLFRHFASTTLENYSVAGYHDFILGNAKSGRQYHTQKEQKAAEDYVKIMSHLTFFDFSAQESTARNLESEMELKKLEIAQLNRQVLELKKEKDKTIIDLNKKITNLESSIECRIQNEMKEIMEFMKYPEKLVKIANEK